MSDKYDQKWIKIMGGLPLPTTWAMTISSTTTIYSESKEYVDASPMWKLHENTHKEQFKKEGWFKFVIKYLWYQITKGYTNNPYEVEARKATGQE